MMRTAPSEAIVNAARLPIITSLRNFWRSDGGAAAIEYAVIASGIAVAIAAAIMTLGSDVKGFYSNVPNGMK